MARKQTLQTPKQNLKQLVGQPTISHHYKPKKKIARTTVSDLLTQNLESLDIRLIEPNFTRIAAARTPLNIDGYVSTPQIELQPIDPDAAIPIGK